MINILFSSLACLATLITRKTLFYRYLKMTSSRRESDGEAFENRFSLASPPTSSFWRLFFEEINNLPVFFRVRFCFEDCREDDDDDEELKEAIERIFKNLIDVRTREGRYCFIYSY